MALCVTAAYLTEMTKANLLTQLENAKNNFILGLAGASLLLDPTAQTILKTHAVSLGSLHIPMAQVSALMSVEADRDIAVKEFVLGQHRALIKETFELLLSYAAETHQSSQLKAAANFHFWRMVRNSVSHDAHWRFIRST